MARASLTSFCLALLCIPAFAQLDVPALPIEPGQDGIAEPFQPEALTRGPVHEAFAEQINADPSLGILVAAAPPEVIDEIPPEYKPEGENVVWIPGYWWWDEDGEDYVWVSGVWRAVPPGQQWVAGYWTEADGGFQWVSGFFTEHRPEELVYQEAPPLSLDNGPTTPAPSDEHFWYPGYWDQGYQWHAGYWHPLREDWVWIPSRWVATPHGCCFIPGHWDYQLAARGQLFAPVRFAQPCPPTFVYRPQCVIQPSLLAMHLFVRPRWRTYCFGDWYDECSTLPMYSYSAYHSRRVGYCPLFAHSRARYARSGINLTVRLGGWNRYFTRNRGFRPQRTFANQLRHAQLHRNRPYSNYVNIGCNLRDLARRNSGLSGRSGSGRLNNGPRLRKIDDRQIAQERKTAQLIRTVARERARRESLVNENAVLKRELTGSKRPGDQRKRANIFRDREPARDLNTIARSGLTKKRAVGDSSRNGRGASNRDTRDKTDRDGTRKPAENSVAGSRRKSPKVPGIVTIKDGDKLSATGPKLPSSRSGKTLAETRESKNKGATVRGQSPKESRSAKSILSRNKKTGVSESSKSEGRSLPGVLGSRSSGKLSSTRSKAKVTESKDSSKSRFDSTPFGNSVLGSKSSGAKARTSTGRNSAKTKTPSSAKSTLPSQSRAPSTARGSSANRKSSVPAASSRKTSSSTLSGRRSNPPPTTSGRTQRSSSAFPSTRKTNTPPPSSASRSSLSNRNMLSGNRSSSSRSSSTQSSKQRSSSSSSSRLGNSSSRLGSSSRSGSGLLSGRSSTSSRSSSTPSSKQRSTSSNSSRLGSNSSRLGTSSRSGSGLLSGRSTSSRSSSSQSPSTRQRSSSSSRSSSTSSKSSTSRSSASRSNRSSSSRSSSSNRSSGGRNSGSGSRRGGRKK